MKRVKIKVIQLGESKNADIWRFIKRLKNRNRSKLFEITSIERLSLPNSDFYWGYSDALLGSIVSGRTSGSDITVCFIDYPLEGNFFFRPITDRIGVATFFETADILQNANVGLNNYILMFFYITTTLYLLGSTRATIANHFHDETRGCLFDMCGLKGDIVVSATKPKICFECELKLKSSTLPQEYSDILKREIKLINKPLYFRIWGWVKSHPILSIIITALFSILINLISSIIYEYLQVCFQ